MVSEYVLFHVGKAGAPILSLKGHRVEQSGVKDRGGSTQCLRRGRAGDRNIGRQAGMRGTPSGIA